MDTREPAVIGKHYRMKQAFDQEELHRREAVCTREDPPPCEAACPLRLDMRAVCVYAAKGDFVRAAGVMRAVTPFLYLLARRCGGKCGEACTLSKLGDGLALRTLELACARYGGFGTRNRFMLPRKNKSAAVYGDDLFALALCWELGNKGYEVLWYTACSAFEDPLLTWGLAKEEAIADGRVLQDLRIRRIEAGNLAEKSGEGLSSRVDVVCVSPGKRPPAGEIRVFTGELFQEPERILAEAKRTARAADRYLQGAGEGEEAPAKESRLFVTMDGVTGSHAQADAETLTKESAMAEAARCIVCECRECIKGCVYLQHYRRNPRAAIREIYNNLSIVMGNHMANGMINSCDECGQCQAACPNGFDYPDVCRIARETMVETKKMPPSAHEFALLDQQFSNGEAFLAKNQPGYETSRYVFFPGCQAACVSPETVEKAYRDLCGRLPGGVGLMLGCCGAISRWAARKDLQKEAEERLKQSWEELGRPVIVCACPTCKRVFDEWEDAESLGIWEVLLTSGVPKTAARTVAIHDACGARGDKKTQDQVRRLVEALGCQVEEIPYSRDRSPCCGFGGLVKYANPEVAGKKADFAAARSEYPLLTYCMACRDQLARAGADSRHILELAYDVQPGPVPDLSARRANRLRLKQRMLEELWEEKTEMTTERPVMFAEGVREKMEERMILTSDVDAVLRAYETSGAAVRDAASGRLAACLRLGNVTFWVSFTKEADGYLVHSAYSHRMTVE